MAQVSLNLNTGNFAFSGNNLGTHSGSIQLTSPIVGGKADIWDSTSTTVDANSANWQNTYTTVNANSATTWNYQGTDLKALSANWQNTYTTVNANSATTWNYQGTDLKALSANWQNTYTTVNSNSATTWNYQGTDLKALSANWQNTVVGLSSTNSLPIGTVTYNCSNGKRYFYHNFNSSVTTGFTSNFTNLGLSAGTATTVKIAVNVNGSSTTFTIGTIEGTTPVFFTPVLTMKAVKDTKNLVTLDILRSLDGTYSVVGWVMAVG